MKKSFALLAALGCVGLAACDVEKTKEGEMPDVDVNVSGGQLPEYNVTTPDVDVRMENKTVQVPVVDVDLPKDK